MPLLYFWRGDNYRRDLDYGAGYHLNQANALLHEIDLGDSLWAFTRTNEKMYVLAAELVISAKTRNAPHFRYGAYRVWGHLQRSRYFLAEGQPHIEQVIRGLSIKPRGEPLGRSFQGKAAVRRITEQDHQILTRVARGLPLEPRARILPEERLEALIILDDEESVRNLVREEQPGIVRERAEYLYGPVVRRNGQLVHELRQFYSGRCQICQWNPLQRYGKYLSEGHHIHWLSRGGEDEVNNMLLLCPNHHRAVHRCDAPFDFSSMSFDFGACKEGLKLNQHLHSALIA